jgi:hypothetical protein
MNNIKWTYYQFRKKHQYPVYVRLHPEVELSKLTQVLTEVGFELLSDVEVRGISLQKAGVKLLTIQEATGKVFSQLQTSDALDQYGLENLSIHSGVSVYTHRRVALLMTPSGKPLWDMALVTNVHTQEHLLGMRVVMTRFLALALAPFGVISYWGTSKDDGVIIMKQGQSAGESVFIDHKKKLIFSFHGETNFHHGLHIHRLDQNKKVGSALSREELMSFTGLTPEMKKSIVELCMSSSASYYWQDAPLSKSLSYA